MHSPHYSIPLFHSFLVFTSILVALSRTWKWITPFQHLYCTASIIKYKLYQIWNKMWTYMRNCVTISYKALVLCCKTVGTACCLKRKSHILTKTHVHGIHLPATCQSCAVSWMFITQAVGQKAQNVILQKINEVTQQYNTYEN